VEEIVPQTGAAINMRAQNGNVHSWRRVPNIRANIVANMTTADFVVIDQVILDIETFDMGEKRGCRYILN